MQNSCFIDLDGVLADLHRAVINHFFVDARQLSKIKPWAWSCLFDWTGLSAEQFFNSLTEDFWAMLPLTAEADLILSLAEARFEDNICLLSSPSQRPEVAAGKIRWVHQHYPKYDRRFFLGSAKHFCAGDTKMLIDDSDHNVEAWEACSGLGILVPRPWNKLHNRDTVDYLKEKLEL